MDELNIFSRIEREDFEFKITDINMIEIVSIITQGNPGSIRVMVEIYKTHDKNTILIFLNKIWKLKIIGSRLWYIYKNECNKNVNELLSKDLTPFTKEYFYHNFEKYI